MKTQLFQLHIIYRQKGTIAKEIEKKKIKYFKVLEYSENIRYNIRELGNIYSSDHQRSGGRYRKGFTL